MRADIKSKVRNRLKRIEGQVRGLQKMIDEEKYCIEVIIQASAIRQALSAFEDVMLENHLSTHVVEQMKTKDHKKAIEEILSVYKVSKKK
jgi:DNA-binding FrmR family transcriptional regulator